MCCTNSVYLLPFALYWSCANDWSPIIKPSNSRVAPESLTIRRLAHFRYCPEYPSLAPEPGHVVGGDKPYRVSRPIFKVVLGEHYNDASCKCWTRRECFVKTIMRSLIGTLLVAAAALGTGWPQSTSQEIRTRDLRAQQPQEVIDASALCQRAREAPRGRIDEAYVIDPSSLVQDLNTLMRMSDEVILAGMLDGATVLSPSGESTATYFAVRVTQLEGLASWRRYSHLRNSRWRR